jgi:acyl-CoA synthetase (AMP-forming)/AMP-acid ligase II
MGRIDNQVKVLGNRIELEDVEAHLRAVCGTSAAAVLPWPIVGGSAGGLVAFVPRAGVSPAVAREQLRRRVPGYMVPSRVVTVDPWPLSTTGKVDREHLRALLRAERNDEGDEDHSAS